MRKIDKKCLTEVLRPESASLRFFGPFRVGIVSRRTPDGTGPGGEVARPAGPGSLRPVPSVAGPAQQEW